jgi:hypothetical protein
MDFEKVKKSSSTFHNKDQRNQFFNARGDDENRMNYENFCRKLCGVLYPAKNYIGKRMKKMNKTREREMRLWKGDESRMRINF